MTRQQDGILAFGIMIATGLSLTAAMSVWAMLGFVCGVVVTLVSAAIANAIE